MRLYATMQQSTFDECERTDELVDSAAGKVSTTLNATLKPRSFFRHARQEVRRKQLRGQFVCSEAVENLE